MRRLQGDISTSVCADGIVVVFAGFLEHMSSSDSRSLLMFLDSDLLVR
jgi:hypothetical protein